LRPTTSGAKRPFESTQHFVTDKELAKGYPVLHWANENALFDTLAGIAKFRKTAILLTFGDGSIPVYSQA
jgi:hypothetical protein